MSTEQIEHPNPQFRRDDWTSLDGEWNFEFDDMDKVIAERWFEKAKANRKVNVPFGYCYTQTTDVQQETNGLLTMARKWKVDPKKVREINEE